MSAETSTIVPPAEVPSVERTSSVSRVRAVVGSAVFVVVAVVLQILRQDGQAMWRTVWAEDGNLFLSDAFNDPLRETVFRGYAGYGHVLPRILASIGSELPAEQYSRWAALSATTVVALLALFVYWASRPLLGAPLRRAILAGSVFLLPVLPIEILGVLANLHWILPIACLFAVLLPVDRPWAIAARLPIVLLGPLSSPLCLVFAPVVVVQIGIAIWRHRQDVRAIVPRTLVVPIAYLVACLGQLAIYATAVRHPAKPMPLGDKVDALARLYPTKVGTNLVFGVKVSQDLWAEIGYGLAWIAMGILVVLLVTKFVRSDVRARLWIGTLVGASVVLFGYSMWTRSEFLASMVPASRSYNFLGARYEVLPAFLLIVVLLLPPRLPRGILVRPVSSADWDDVTTDGPAGARPGWWSRFTGGLPWKVLLVCAAIWVAVAIVPSYRQTTARSTGPSWIVAAIDGAAACAGRPSSDQTILDISPTGWKIALTCGELDAGDSRPEGPSQ